ncbi:MAG TPA: formyltransferase family protein [Azospirillum sp.]
MRILICTKRDLAGNLLLNRMLPRLAGHDVRVLLANRVRAETETVPDLGALKFFEQDLPVEVLFSLLDSAPEPPAGAELLSFRHLERRFGVPIATAGHIGNGPLTDLVRAAEPDLVVSVQFGFIFRPDALAIPRLGLMNLHSGALPGRAGVNPTFWCMLEGEAEAACSLHWITAAIDAGPIIEVRATPIDYGRSFLSNWVRNYETGAAMIVDAVERLERDGMLPAVPQDDAARVFVPKPTPDDFARFRAQGHRVVDHGEYLELLRRWLPAAPPVMVAAT